YFVRRRASDAVRGFSFPGRDSQPAPGVLDALAEADLVVIAPSNPFVSITPILVVRGVHDALAGARGRRAAVSPIVGGAAVKGPAAAMMKSLGYEVSATTVARLYHGLIDRLVVDNEDEALLPEIRALGIEA